MPEIPEKGQLKDPTNQPLSHKKRLQNEILTSN